VRTTASGYDSGFDLPALEPPNPSIAWITDVDIDAENRIVVGSSTTNIIYLWDFML
jgi:hypothetical protein